MKWEKKELDPEQVKKIAAQYGCDLLTASILIRRGLDSGDSVKYFLENDLRYLRNPFELPGMEDAVERILAAREEEEKILVFGDSDVDGITGTVLLTEYLTGLGMDVSWRIPLADDAYGLSLEAVEEFAQNYGSLIITVDCGISRIAEVKRANELGIDVIVTDHHEAQEELPPALAIVDPKLKDSPYPFRDLAGCGVAFKLVSALRFAQKSELYNQSICLLNTRPLNDAWVIEIAKLRNLVVTNTLIETIVPGMVRISDTRLPAFLEGQQILVWDAPLQKRTMSKLFGNGVEVAMMDIAPEIGKVIPQAAGQSLLRIKELSKIARYAQKELAELDVFVNLFNSFVRAREKIGGEEESPDLQLAALGTIADIMPLLDENRILVRWGLESIKTKPRHGIAELLYRLELAGRRFDTKDISWKFCPAINAARRMGKPEVAASLFFAKESAERDRLAGELVSMNEERKSLEEEVWAIAEPQAFKTFTQYSEKLALVYGEEINRGVTGLVAQRLTKRFNVPAIAVSFNGEFCTGSLRSVQGYNVCALLDQCKDLFVDHGGHEYAAGFTLEKSNWDSFAERLEMISRNIEFTSEQDEQLINIDAELPPSYLTPDIFSLVDRFEPFGKENNPLTFLTRKLTVTEINFIGKTESKHLKMILDTGKHKWPALYWQAGDRVLNGEFAVQDKVDVVFNLSRDWFNGRETPQMMITALEKSEI